MLLPRKQTGLRLECAEPFSYTATRSLKCLLSFDRLFNAFLSHSLQ